MNQEPMGRGFKLLAIASVIGMFIVQLQGALVTKSGSAEGCGSSWPSCDGQLWHLGTTESIIEYSHRAVSGLVGLLVVAFAILAWRRYSHRKDIRAFAVVAVLFIIIQSLLGAAAVMWEQPTVVLALHFGISLTAFASVLLPVITMFQLERGETHRHKPVSSGMQFWAWSALIFVYGIVYSGAYVRHTNSHLACLEWPLCQGVLIPELTGEVGIQFFHRLVAGLGWLLLLWLVRVAWRERKVRPDLYRGAVWAATLMTLQVLSGGVVILTYLTLISMMIHSAIITALFGALSYLCLQVHKDPISVASPSDKGIPG